MSEPCYKEGGSRRDLSTVVFELSPDRGIQLRRRLCSLPLIRHQVVEANGWLQLSEFTDLITISQMTPGPIAVNSATFVGLKVAGIPGAVVCTLGCVLPSCILVSLIAKLYLKYRSMDLLQGVLKGLRPAVVALIASAGVDIMVSALNIGGQGRIKLQMAVIFAICLVLLRKKWNPILVMVLAGVMQVIYGYIMMLMGI